MTSRSLVVLLFGMFLAGPRVGASEGSEDDPAQTCLALLRHQGSLCRAIADDIETAWTELGSRNPGAAQEAMRRRVLNRHSGDLAQARAAGDEARNVLQRLRREGSAHQVVDDLDRLRQLETSLCDLSALPTSPLEDFSKRSVELRRASDRQDRTLGRRLALDEVDLDRLLLPFLPRLQIASIEAEGELLDHRRRQRPPPPPPDPAGPMKSWHLGYSREAAGAKDALRRYLAAQRDRDGRGVVSACRDLSSEIPRVLDQLDRRPPPDPMVRNALVDAYGDLRQVGVRCAAGRQREADLAYRAFQGSLSRAAEALARWGLAP